MARKIMKKETFCKIIRALEKARTSADEIEDGIENTLRNTSRFRNDMDFVDLFGLLHNTELENELIGALETEFELPEKNNTLQYFIYDLEFGKKYTSGCLTDDKGNDVSIATPEELYDTLVNDL